MIKVIFDGTAFAAGGGTTTGVLGTYPDILSAYSAAESHCRKWCESHQGKTLRPVHGPCATVRSWSDPSKVKVYAYGGWGDCFHMDYSFSSGEPQESAVKS